MADFLNIALGMALGIAGAGVIGGGLYTWARSDITSDLANKRELSGVVAMAPQLNVNFLESRCYIPLDNAKDLGVVKKERVVVKLQEPSRFYKARQHLPESFCTLLKPGDKVKFLVGDHPVEAPAGGQRYLALGAQILPP